MRHCTESELGDFPRYALRLSDESNGYTTGWTLQVPGEGEVIRKPPWSWCVLEGV